MSELAGLLGTARTKLRGLLGDFPEGFNAGAVAGVAGWPGDLAYGIDTARLALTGAPEQAPARDFPGTTDYIAAQAGHPIPQTMSGQIGAALGGMLTPGPGDLARLAPLGAMFLPARAAGANRKVLELAMAMHAEGKNADEIRQATGALGQPWSLGRDGIWRFEISDADARPRHLAMDELPRDQSMYTLSDFLDHPALFEADPTLADTPVRLSTYQNQLLPSGSRGQVSTEIGPDLTLRPVITLSDMNWVDKGNIEAPLEPLLHEPMHVIQQKYGLASGGSPSEFADMGQAAANRAYRSLAGEDEAFNVWNRHDMTLPERIEFGPELTADVPYEQQIVRFGGRGPQMAIPFWHGSPHAYDAVDLSKIGTGEGAQAYGWGYYGADLPDTAMTYTRTTPNAPWYSVTYNGETYKQGDIRGSTLTSIAERGRAEVIARLENDAEYLRSIGKEDQARQYFEEAQFARSVDPNKVQIHGGNLYRGEYGWGDPAREAATPLAGEDLLDWDAPLDQQNPAVRALAEKIYGGEVPARNSYGEVLRGRDLLEKTKQRLGSVHFRKELDSLGIGNAPGGLEEIAARYMAANGVPGVRYFDGVSRNAGEGTHNYVMFDDQGIRLFERNGKPIARTK